MTIKLKDVLAEDLTAWVAFTPAEFDVKIRYLSMKGHERLVKDCQEVSYRSHQRIEVMNEEKFKRKIADLIVDWRDMTASKLRKICGVKAGVGDDDIPCTPENKLEAIGRLPGFVTFVIDAAKELFSHEQTEEQEAEKN